ncbi:unnamed protein product [Adineta ricciae]|uniref:Nuclear receptor domain-containing protein n=1 Tax=Adineta ricciae TaxID=249248 RepID=A0A816E3T0_ADIRI|nr:unnamed protein product [Adineta ricciae]CAF1641795.1 unnamed protein product [Adineta ricciae]
MDILELASNDRTKKGSTTVLIVKSGSEDDDEKFLMDLIQSSARNNTKRLNNDEVHDQRQQTAIMKRRKADLTCVVCGGSAFGYNFGQITCESCKAFFRRTAFHPLEKTKCQNKYGLQCNIRHDNLQKCQRCRLLKCFESGMRKDLISTREEKLNRLKLIEENRRLYPREIKGEPLEVQIEVNNEVSYQLTKDDWSCLNSIQDAYRSSSLSTPPVSSMFSLELTSDKMLTYMNTLDIQNVNAIRMINFVRQIEDFASLNENDRVTLVKYNSSMAGLMRFSLTFDRTRELWHLDPEDDQTSPVSEAFAEQCKSLFILCYGYELFRSVANMLHVLEDLVNKDPIIVQLLVLSMIFLKGLSASDDREAMLYDYQRVFQAHSKYVDLLFRYLAQQSSFEQAAMKMVRVVEVLLKLQNIMRNFQQQVKTKIDVNYINPLMKSLLNLT